MLDQLDLATGTGTLLPSAAEFSPARARPLCVAVVNNMPDAALHGTERQFCALLEAASAGMVVNVKFYTLPGIPRSDAAREHIAQCYEDFALLEQDRPDGLIVTGTEPKAARLQDEPYWDGLARLVDWTEEHGVPTIWSCLAAHAAVLQADGITRQPLPAKLSGVFECASVAERKPLLHRIPRKWRMPHSRRNGLDRKQLEANGYTILSASAAAGVDMFMKQVSALQVFVQGHPEYEAATLVSEYRRDVLRCLARPGSAAPSVPAGLGSRSLRAELGELAQSMARGGRLGDMARLDEMLSGLAPEDGWRGVARHLLTNWLAQVEMHRQRRCMLVPQAVFGGVFLGGC